MRPTLRNAPDFVGFGGPGLGFECESLRQAAEGEPYRHLAAMLDWNESGALPKRLPPRPPLIGKAMLSNMLV